MAHWSNPSTPSNMDCQLLGHMFIGNENKNTGVSREMIRQK